MGINREIGLFERAHLIRLAPIIDDAELVDDNERIGARSGCSRGGFRHVLFLQNSIFPLGSGQIQLYASYCFRYDEVVRMKLSTQTILVLGLVQCIVLTLILVLFFRYQRTLESDDTAVPVTETSTKSQK